ncbi:hypothetical protein PN499_15730 [Kamptonema animale CS-326]|jgi:hypothetical protein|uniref:hypothetical protein n=1 Tax=Kamptonema animale TaxID=92934 RepID=UPI0023302A35|nr:hypothetical protein [Kamptonema animale]MDB9512638.1 hypothetical protein [Kamptonema animale CS-326]
METVPKLTFKYGWDERDEVETPMKGCRSDGIVSLADGKTYCVYFIDPIRLQAFRHSSQPIQGWDEWMRLSSAVMSSRIDFEI